MFVAPLVSAVEVIFNCVPCCSRWKMAVPAVNTRQSTSKLSVSFTGNVKPATGG
jgi:hypothetical protein